ncbi:MAG: GDP-L-fucose synthase [Candidatus Calescibacterium sp.]|nr:GDP-L-fucose synthase [Candidatus Calescibacterium sp.]MDW8086389.1 GDP-L-fucose synthase [Candidatus Calescibacterium sp.]
MQSDSKIVVFGASGLVGNSILKKLINRGYKNIVSVYRTKLPEVDGNTKLVKLDLIRQQEVEDFFQREKPEYVFFAASRVGGIYANSTYKADFIYENIIIAANVIHSSFKFGVRKLLNLGSSCIYPRNSPQPMKEEYLLTGMLEATNEPYAIAKISAIKLCRYYNEQYGTNFISVMPTNLYGPGDNFDLMNSHVLPALIRKFHLGKLILNEDWENLYLDIRRRPIDSLDRNSKREDILAVLRRYGVDKGTVYVWGTGEVYREFLYVEDMADACVFLMEKIDAKDMKKISPDFFVNVGVGEDIKIKDLAKMVKEVVGFSGKIEHDLTKPDGVPRKLLDISKIRELGWEPKLKDIIEGIKITYQWYLKDIHS